MKKYTIREAYENKYSIWCTTIEQAELINKLSGASYWGLRPGDGGFEVFIDKIEESQYANCSWQGGYNKTFFINASESKATKCIDFSELKLENEMEEIIGYKLIAPEFQKAALTICNTVGNWENSLAEYDISVKQTGYINKLKNAEVFDKWFEPVYAPQFKIGDYVIWKKEKDQNNVYKICGISDNGYDLEWKGRNVFYGKENIPFRKATEKEISDRLTKTLILGDTKIEITISKNSIKADGKEWKIQTIKDFRNIMFPDRNIKDYKIEFPSIKIGCCTFTLNEIQTIIDTYLDLNGSN